ncbi:MAG: hypothetical protein ACOC95_08160 [Planctomycetota bacterium]
MLVVVLAALAGGLVATWAQTPPPVARAQTLAPKVTGPITAVAGPLSADTYGLYLIDTDLRSLAVYEYIPSAREGSRLVLRAARNVRYDLQLDAYNTEPDPAEIADLIRQSRPIDP